VALALSGCSSASLMNANSPSAGGTAPAVVAVGVQNNGVAPNRWQYVQFNEAMDPATINSQTFTVADSSGKLVTGNVIYNASYDVAGFQPNPALQDNASYTATITTGVASSQGMHLPAAYTYTFTTRASTDASPLFVKSVTPAPNATCVSATSPITITFSEGADVSTVNSSNIVITGPANAVIQAQISYDVATAVATLTPSAALPSGTITVTVKKVADAAGVAMTSVYGWSFQTTCGSGGGGTGREFLYVSAPLYVNAEGTPEIDAYGIDPATGNLSPVPGMPFQPGFGAVPFACHSACSLTPLADPAGRFLFYDFSWSPSQQGFGTMSVDSATGALTNDDVLVIPPTFLTMSPATPPNVISIDPKGRFIFGSGQTSNEPAVGQQQNWIRSVVVAPDGHLSFAPGEPFDFPGVAGYGSPAVSDQFVYVSDYSDYSSSPPSDLYGFSIDQTTGALSAVSTTNDGTAASAQVITPSGKFLYVGRLLVNNTVPYAVEIAGYQVNADGSLTQLSQAPQQTPVQGTTLMMSPNGNFLYHFGRIYNYAIRSSYIEIRAYAIDQNTGALSLTAVYDDANFLFLVIDPAVKYVYIAQADNSDPSAPAFTLNAFTVNPTNGAITPAPGPPTSLPANPTAAVIVRPQ